MRKVTATSVFVLAAIGWVAASQDVQLPREPTSVKFAVIGDNGTGAAPQYDVGTQMVEARARFPFEFVIMLGDNMYGRQQPQDYVNKFERPYASLLQALIPFYAALGNHDDQAQRFYKGFNMGNERYYTFAKKHVRFFVFDSNLMDRAQVAWIDDTLKQSPEDWKIVYFHHPLYSDGGRHGSNVELRVMLEPLLVRHGVAVVFSGHEHVYERIRPQKGITYFIVGASGQLRKGDITTSELTAVAFDRDQTFMLVEIAGDGLFFQTISRTGRVVDSGVIRRRPTT
jgi:3',5'-cyclic AMP phosphodiesterase CpdA